MSGSQMSDTFQELLGGAGNGKIELPADPVFADDQEEFSYRDEDDAELLSQDNPESISPDIAPEEEESNEDPANPEAAEGEADPLAEDNAPEAKAEDSEYIFVSDDTGRKKLKVDYSDREGIKTAYKLAAGYTKMKSARDRMLVEGRETGKEMENLRGFQKTLNETYTQDGIAGIYNKVRTEDMPSWEDLIVQEAVRIQQYKAASPEAQRAMDDSKELQKLKVAQQEWVKQQESLKTQAEEAREAAELEKFEAMIVPGFEKHRFTEIADAGKAERMDARLWREAKEEFKRLEDAGEVVTQAVAVKVFKDIADDIRSLIQGQATQQATDVVEKKKKAAQTKVAGATERARKDTTKEESFQKDILEMGGVQAFMKMIGRA